MNRKTLKIAGHDISFETGEIARQADGAVIVRQRNAAVLATAVAARDPRSDTDFFPLTVDYRELYGAAGVIPHVYGKREGRMSEREILISRIIDRSIRPLFPKDFRCETQIIATLLSADPDVDSDILGLLAATAALRISDIPWQGPAAGLRIAKTASGFVINPTRSQRRHVEMELTISCGRDGLVMMEGHANETEETVILEAIDLAQKTLLPVFDFFDDWRASLDLQPRRYKSPESHDYIQSTVIRDFEHRINETLNVQGKKQRNTALYNLREELRTHYEQSDLDNLALYESAFDDIKYNIVRQRILKNNRRLDGRGSLDIRHISGRVDWLYQPHGSAVFTRGETQACVNCTIGSPQDSLKTETVYGDEESSFFLHYQFPPYSVGETKPMRGPGRREIGHGYLAWNALKPVFPERESFPYTVRIYSEITESHGSSSMATVCGGCLALMDAGVPIKKPVAGVAMGLISEEETTVILSDITGDEDHLGDMDFKVAGTEKGITAIQMDNKIGKLPIAILQTALQQARTARCHILEKMRDIIPAPRKSLKSHAPRMITLTVRPERIRDIIGPGGKTIKSITESSSAEISINDDGAILIFAKTQMSAESARRQIAEIVQEPQVGVTYNAKVVSIKPFGVFVELFPGTEGLVHISEWEPGDESLFRALNIGDSISVVVLGVDEKGRIKLSRS
ncbi:polyribonucleotide nucleotidyltransferase [bacterium]|nr:polyribonucleotide nucleotidyltransferase [candidate division CSSED10-310 bacterium]